MKCDFILLMVYSFRIEICNLYLKLLQITEKITKEFEKKEIWHHWGERLQLRNSCDRSVDRKIRHEQILKRPEKYIRVIYVILPSINLNFGY